MHAAPVHTADAVRHTHTHTHTHHTHTHTHTRRQALRPQEQQETRPQYDQATIARFSTIVAEVKVDRRKHPDASDEAGVG
eukprot:44584-Eustigmatos_ZCMA.PRE.1